jgi:hypothetical protein
MLTLHEVQIWSRSAIFVWNAFRYGDHLKNKTAVLQCDICTAINSSININSEVYKIAKHTFRKSFVPPFLILCWFSTVHLLRGITRSPTVAGALLRCHTALRFSTGHRCNFANKTQLSSPYRRLCIYVIMRIPPLFQNMCYRNVQFIMKDRILYIFVEFWQQVANIVSMMSDEGFKLSQSHTCVALYAPFFICFMIIFSSSGNKYKETWVQSYQLCCTTVSRDAL